ncbi:ferritin-like domain-containing protein [Mesoaciditoga sp.]
MKDYLYSADELLEMALKIEEDGEKFYTFLSEKLEDDRKKELFSYLAGQEREHAETFKELSKGLVEETDPSFWEEASKYIRSIVENKIFPSLEEMKEKSKNMTLNQLLDFAISIEKETVIFYEELYDMVREKKSKEILSKIIREEVSHVRKLSLLKE